MMNYSLYGVVRQPCPCKDCKATLENVVARKPFREREVGEVIVLRALKGQSKRLVKSCRTPLESSHDLLRKSMTTRKVLG